MLRATGTDLHEGLSFSRDFSFHPPIFVACSGLSLQLPFLSRGPFYI
jgi:hypothetical protein